MTSFSSLIKLTFYIRNKIMINIVDLMDYTLYGAFLLYKFNFVRNNILIENDTSIFQLFDITFLLR